LADFLADFLAALAFGLPLPAGFDFTDRLAFARAIALLPTRKTSENRRLT
jgi:hypothetical protein